MERKLKLLILFLICATVLVSFVKEIFDVKLRDYSFRKYSIFQTLDFDDFDRFYFSVSTGFDTEEEITLTENQIFELHELLKNAEKQPFQLRFVGFCFFNLEAYTSDTAYLKFHFNVGTDYCNISVIDEDFDPPKQRTFSSPEIRDWFEKYNYFGS